MSWQLWAAEEGHNRLRTHPRTPLSPAALTIEPRTDTLGPRGTRTFFPIVAANLAAVTWTLREGAAGGTVTADAGGLGVYVAPAAPGTYHVVATSVADRSKTATAIVQVVKSGFTTAGWLTVSRLAHTATELSNGKVLIAGGGLVDFDHNTSNPEADLFDPSTGTSTVAGTFDRSLATATLLANGKVLLTGGRHGDFPHETITETAKTYNSATGQFKDVGDMATPRASHRATLLADGRVLVTGGVTGEKLLTLSAAEIYDSASGTFASTGSMVTSRIWHTTTLLTNGKVLLTGGFSDVVEDAIPSAELYDPVTSLFTPTGSMGEKKAGHTATLMPNGDVLVIGGGATGVGTAEVYDPSTGMFTAAGHMSLPRSWHSATLLPDGKC